MAVLLSVVPVAIATAAMAAVLLPTDKAMALEYQWGEWLINIDTTLGAGAQWRTESRDKDIVFDPLSSFYAKRTGFQAAMPTISANYERYRCSRSGYGQ